MMQQNGFVIHVHSNKSKQIERREKNIVFAALAREKNWLQKTSETVRVENNVLAPEKND